MFFSCLGDSVSVQAHRFCQLLPGRWRSVAHGGRVFRGFAPLCGWKQGTFSRISCRSSQVLEEGKEKLNLNTSWSKMQLHLLKAHISLCLACQMFKVPSLGPGCAHFRTCSMCLTAPLFMNCGWCSGVCSRQHECTSQWSTDSCAPVITEVWL